MRRACGANRVEPREGGSRPVSGRVLFLSRHNSRNVIRELEDARRHGRITIHGSRFTNKEGATITNLLRRYEDSKLYRIRHSTAHIMAQAVHEQFPDGKIAIGPAIEEGFYYDFDLPRNVNPEDLEPSRSAWWRSSKATTTSSERWCSADEAREVFRDQPYKLELIAGLEKGEVDEHGNPVELKPEISLYKDDSLWTCAAGRTWRIRARSTRADQTDAGFGGLLARRRAQPHAAAHLRHGLEHAEEFKDYLWRLEEAKKRDHRKLGRELEIFTFDDEVGPGLALVAAQRRRDDRRDRKVGQEMEARPATCACARRTSPKKTCSCIRATCPTMPSDVPADGAGRGQILRQADELPDAP